MLHLIPENSTSDLATLVCEGGYADCCLEAAISLCAGGSLLTLFWTQSGYELESGTGCNNFSFPRLGFTFND